MKKDESPNENDLQTPKPQDQTVDVGPSAAAMRAADRIEEALNCDDRDQTLEFAAIIDAEISPLLQALKGALLSVEWRVAVMYGDAGLYPDPEACRALSLFAVKCRALIDKAEGRS